MVYQIKNTPISGDNRIYFEISVCKLMVYALTSDMPEFVKIEEILKENEAPYSITKDYLQEERLFIVEFEFIERGE